MLLEFLTVVKELGVAVFLILLVLLIFAAVGEGAGRG